MCSGPSHCLDSWIEKMERNPWCPYISTFTFFFLVKHGCRSKSVLLVDIRCLWCLSFLFLFAELKEYCHLDMFNATCPHGSVVMMVSARYGRMRVGRCLTTSYFIGCYADVLPFMDSICSGRRTCAIKTLDTELVKFQPCRKDLMPYLEAQYKCISSEYIFCFCLSLLKVKKYESQLYTLYLSVCSFECGDFLERLPETKHLQYKIANIKRKYS